MSFGDWKNEEDPSEDPQADTAADDEETAAPQLVYGSAVEFFREYLRKVYVRRVNGQATVWDARWWEVDEALVRIESLWRAWEFLRQDASTGTSVWFRDHVDHHMAVLMSAEGPFAGSEAKTKRGEALPHEEPPEGLFPDVRNAE